MGMSHASAGPNAFSLTFLFGLVPLVNMPFAWLSIAVSRTLMRRACAIGASWRSVVLGVTDFLFDLLLLFTLAFALVVSVSVADDIIVYRGINPVANVCNILGQIRTDPGYPGNYWIYVI